MPVHNSEIAEMFEEVADLLEIEGANEFRIRAYRNASRVVAGLSKSAADLVADEKALTELPGIGKDLAGKIAEICRTGKFPVLEECRSRASPGIRMLSAIGRLSQIFHAGDFQQIEIAAISTDAHRISDLDLMRFGVSQARRGWLEPQDVVNTRSWPELQELLKRRP
jgi:DNA polymerase/3'-5' exonuclease PolX